MIAVPFARSPAWMVAGFVFALLFGLAGRASAQPASPPAQHAALVVDDFESYDTGQFPGEWVYVTRDREIRSYAEVEEAGEEVAVRSEDGNQFVRFITKDATARYTKRNGTDFDWSVDERPVLQWRWRALELPEGASERGENDTGAAVYVTFGTDWLGRPKSIKYTYSSALSIGETVDFGSLKVVVVDSRPDSEMSTWQTVRRHVAEDYRQLFGEEPPNRPAGITLWSDTDTTHGTARVDFDNVRLLPPFSGE